jgi:outer membrane immunogenic protein
MMNKLVSGAFVALLMSGSAYAADLFIAPSDPVIIDEMAYDWSGFYIGAQAGYLFGTGVVDIPAYAQPLFDVDMDGFAAGLHVGANAQFDQFVVGVELAGNWIGADGRALSGGGGGEEYVIDQNWDASLVGRIGFAADRFHVYGLGGGAVTSISTNYDPAAFADSTDTVFGWTVGVGTEYAFTDNVSFGVEYRYTNYAIGDFVHGGPSSVDLDTHAVKARLSYRF